MIPFIEHHQTFYQRQQEMIQLDPNDSVYSWNNSALLCMQEGRWAEAETILFRLLARLESEPQVFRVPEDVEAGAEGCVASRTRAQTRRLLSSITERTTSQQEVPSPSLTEEDVSLEDMLMLITVPVNHNLSNAQIPTSAPTSFALFDQAFCTVMHHQGLLRRGSRLTKAFCCYNLALCLHYQAKAHYLVTRNVLQHFRQVNRSVLNPRMAQAALSYYRKALTILESGHGCGEGRPEDNVLLLCAIYNNLGHLHCTLLQPRQETEQQQQQGLSIPERQCFDCMKALLADKAKYHQRLGTPLHAFSNDWIFFVCALQNFAAYEYRLQQQPAELNQAAAE